MPGSEMQPESGPTVVSVTDILPAWKLSSTMLPRTHEFVTVTFLACTVRWPGMSTWS